MPSSAKPTLMVIDGHSLAFRAFYALPVDSFQTSDGQHTNAIHGFISMLLNLLNKEKPTHLAVAFDISRYSFRTREYPEYKATRGETPAEFIGQIPLLEDALHAMNIVTLTKEDFEADDILATLSRQGAEQGFHVLVVSGDRDTIQLVNDDVTLLYPSKQGVSELTRYNDEKVFERYGIRPEQYPDIAALVGETSDNLPGVPKVGEKTAVKWLNEFGSLQAILDNRESIPGVVGQNLRDHVESVVRNRRLNRLVTDLELPVGPVDLLRQEFDIPRVKEVFTRLEFRSLQERILKLSATAETSAAATPLESPSTSPGQKRTIGSAPTPSPERPISKQLLDEELAAWLAREARDVADGVAVHVELYDGAVSAIGLATPQAACVVPWTATTADVSSVVDWLAGPEPKYFFAAKPQLKALSKAGIAVANLAWDVELADWLLRSDVSQRVLADVVDIYLGEQMPTTDADALIQVDDALNAADAAWYIARTVPAMRDRFEARELSLLLEIEIPTMLTLAAMETRGITVSRKKLAELNASLGERAAEVAQLAYAEIGREVNLASPKQLQEVLFEQLEMPKTRATKTGYSTDAAALADLQASHPHPFLGYLLEHRDVTKLRQIVEVLENSIGSDGRIHTTYQQTGTSTGRLSSVNPNLQNIPIRSEVGREIRDAFSYGTGFETILTADYSQIEMRIMAHFSQDAGLIEAFNSGEDLHNYVGSRVFGVPPSDVTAEMRTKVKAMSYGLAYGLSAFGLAKQLRIENSEAKALMSDYFERFGGVRDYLRSVVEDARKHGFTETILGRRRNFPDLASPNRVLREVAERAALNAPMQGTAADIMKIAMNGIETELVSLRLTSQLLLQVHDELVLEIAPGELEQVQEIVTRHMSSAAELRVPLSVQVGVGATWNSAAH